jgi:glutamate-1-semialdehyde 2,1-aminomutase
MVKFSSQNGSDVTRAAVRLARAVTGRPLVAVYRDQPLFSTDDWLIGVTAMAAGLPDAIREVTLAFPYGDLVATEQLLRRYHGQIAGLILEPTTQHDPPDNLPALLELAHRYSALVIFDEMIPGFRPSVSGGPGLFGVRPDLSTFGKALGSVSRCQRWPVAVTSWSEVASARNKNGYSSSRQPTGQKHIRSQRHSP